MNACCSAFELNFDQYRSRLLFYCGKRLAV